MSVHIPGAEAPWSGARAQTELREIGTCALFYRLPDDTPVMCGHQRPCPIHEPDPNRKGALEVLAMLQKYEDEHPAVFDGGICLEGAMIAVQEALDKAGVDGTRGASPIPEHICLPSCPYGDHRTQAPRSIWCDDQRCVKTHIIVGPGATSCRFT